jgi:hypothetical protein
MFNATFFLNVKTYKYKSSLTWVINIANYRSSQTRKLTRQNIEAVSLARNYTKTRSILTKKSELKRGKIYTRYNIEAARQAQ